MVFVVESKLLMTSLETALGRKPSPVGRHGGTVVSIAVSQHQELGFNSGLRSLSVQSLHILSVSAWVSSGCSGFLPQSKDVQGRWIDHGKLTISVRRISRVNTWGCRDGVWMGLLLVQA